MAFPDQDGKTCSNWSGTIRFTPKSIHRPKTLNELKTAIRTVEENGQQVKAVGHGCSFSRAIMHADNVINTDRLNRTLEIRSRSTRQVTPPHSSLPLRRSLEDLGMDGFVYTQGGTRIRDLFSALRSFDNGSLVMPTVGGAQMQTIVGATSTGTHGSDLNRQPLADWIRAVHLVAANGQEFWIEPNDERRLTERADLAQWLPGVEHIYDDDLFDSVKVAVGRFGVIYSLVYELKRTVRIKERRWAEPWSVLAADARSQSLHSFIESRNIVDSRNLHQQDNFQMHHFTLAVSLGGDNNCYVTRQHITSISQTRPKPPPPDFSDPAFLDDCCVRHVLGDRKIAALKGLLAGNVVPYTALENAERADLSDLVIGKIQESGVFVDEYSRIVSAPDPPTNAVDSAEFIFNAETKHWIDFAQSVLTAAKSPQMGGWLSVRFTPRTDALLGMQQFGMSAHVEVTAVRTVPGSGSVSQTDSFMQGVDQIARRMGAIPHWGQRHSRREGEYRRLYGLSNFQRWKRALRLVSGNRDQRLTFSSFFTRRAGLEPTSANASFWVP